MAGFEPVPDNVMGSAFWLLSADENSPHHDHAWYKPDGETTPIVRHFLDWITTELPQEGPIQKPTKQIEHYLLLPTFDGEILDSHLDVIRPYLKKHRPTIGFSLEEAEQAKRVTVLGSSESYPEGKINTLRNTGCVVLQIDENGMDVASL
jgi:hypothetical protein